MHSASSLFTGLVIEPLLDPSQFGCQLERLSELNSSSKASRQLPGTPSGWALGGDGGGVGAGLAGEAVGVDVLVLVLLVLCLCLRLW